MEPKDLRIILKTSTSSDLKTHCEKAGGSWEAELLEKEELRTQACYIVGEIGNKL